MADDIPQLSDEGKEYAFQQFLELFVEPELRERLADGRMSEGDTVHAWQVLLFTGGKRTVRLNEEVRAIALAQPAREGMAVGDALATDDIAGIDELLLLEDEPADAAHVTAIQHRGAWSMSFDFRYNGGLVAEHLRLADGFIEAAERALDAGHLEVFADNAFSATELLVKAELITSPDENLLKSKKHRTLASRYHLHASLGNTEDRFPRLLTDLFELRGPGRYLHGTWTLDGAGARSKLAMLKDLRERVERIRPKRAAAVPG